VVPLARRRSRAGALTTEYPGCRRVAAHRPRVPQVRALSTREALGLTGPDAWDEEPDQRVGAVDSRRPAAVRVGRDGARRFLSSPAATGMRLPPYTDSRFDDAQASRWPPHADRLSARPWRHMVVVLRDGRPLSPRGMAMRALARISMLPPNWHSPAWFQRPAARALHHRGARISGRTPPTWARHCRTVPVPVSLLSVIRLSAHGVALTI